MMGMFWSGRMREAVRVGKGIDGGKRFLEDRENIEERE